MPDSDSIFRAPINQGKADPFIRQAPAEFIGMQPGVGAIPDFELWNLTASVGEYPEGTTLSRQTIEALGFFLPPAPAVVGINVEHIEGRVTVFENQFQGPTFGIRVADDVTVTPCSGY